MVVYFIHQMKNQQSLKLNALTVSLLSRQDMQTDIDLGIDSTNVTV